MNTNMKQNRWRQAGCLSYVIGAAACLLAAITSFGQGVSLPAPALTLGTNDINFNVDTNWAAAGYAIYRTDTHEWGYGGTVLYQVTPYFWTGIRADNISGQSTTAGIQAQLQANVTYLGVTLTPFWEASTGLSSSSLYASTGPGFASNFHTWNFKVAGHQIGFSIGAAGDYEHVVNGSRNWNQICFGPLGQLTF